MEKIKIYFFDLFCITKFSTIFLFLFLTKNSVLEVRCKFFKRNHTISNLFEILFSSFDYRINCVVSEQIEKYNITERDVDIS